MAKRNNLYIYVILDGSGSMAGVQDDVVGGVNDFIKEQKELDASDTFFSLTVFDERIKQWYSETPMQDVEDVDKSVTFLGGGTALLDAFGKTLADAQGKQHEGRKMVLVYTDGLENRSKEWTNSGVKKIKEELEAEGDWAFTFMSADIDNFDQAEAMGFAAGNYATTNSSKTYGNLVGTSRATNSFRNATPEAAMAASADWYNVGDVASLIDEAEKERKEKSRS